MGRARPRPDWPRSSTRKKEKIHIHGTGAGEDTERHETQADDCRLDANAADQADHDLDLAGDACDSDDDDDGVLDAEDTCPYTIAAQADGDGGGRGRPCGHRMPRLGLSQPSRQGGASFRAPPFSSSGELEVQRQQPALPGDGAAVTKVDVPSSLTTRTSESKPGRSVTVTASSSVSPARSRTSSGSRSSQPSGTTL
jgi:hypothetical protein